MDSKMNLVIVTGISGAGKTVALRSLEDAGFYCVDNLPPQMISQFIGLAKLSANDIQHVAIAIDSRTLDFLEALPGALSEIEQITFIDYQMLFLDANDDILVKRYKQSRRKHPLADANSPLVAIQKERDLLYDVQERADVVLDTSSLKPVELKEKILNHFENKGSEMVVNVMSFGFKYGIPMDVDLVFDVRFLPNPYYVEQLRPKTGKDEEVASYIFGLEPTKEYVAKLLDFITYSLPHYVREGKQQLVIGIGCTGGKHRSVALTEYIGNTLSNEYNTFISHRDVGKE